MLSALSTPLDAVVLLEVDYDQIIKRISGRRSCALCGRVFNIHTAPPGMPPRCDRCDDKPPLLQRRDDEESTVRQRLAVYEQQTGRSPPTMPTKACCEPSTRTAAWTM